MVNTLINNEYTSISAFNLLVDYADQSIDKIDTEIDEERVCILIESELLSLNVYNVGLLFDKDYKKALGYFVEGNHQDSFIDLLLSNQKLIVKVNDDFIYNFLWF